MKKILILTFVSIIGIGFWEGICNPNSNIPTIVEDPDERYIKNSVDFKSVSVEYDRATRKFKVEVEFYSVFDQTYGDFVMMLDTKNDDEWDYFIRCKPDGIAVKGDPLVDIVNLEAVYLPTVNGDKYQFEFKASDIGLPSEEFHIQFWFEEITDYPVIDRMPDAGTLNITEIL